MSSYNIAVRVIVLLLFVNGSTVLAQGNLSVTEETSLNADAKTVWGAIGDFGGLHTWHPAAKGTVLTGSGTDAGDTRVLDLGDGASITEVLVDHDNAMMYYSYVITASPLPVVNYFSTLKVLPDGPGSRVIWSSTFNAKDAPDKEAIDAITGIYKGGFEALKTRFK